MWVQEFEDTAPSATELTNLPVTHSPKPDTSRPKVEVHEGPLNSDSDEERRKRADAEAGVTGKSQDEIAED